jgi:hypothetical protein
VKNIDNAAFGRREIEIAEQGITEIRQHTRIDLRLYSVWGFFLEAFISECKIFVKAVFPELFYV